MTYKFALSAAMTSLACDPRTRFVGYGLRKGRAMGTLASVPDGQIVETPVAENLMMGVAIGISLRGLLPVVYFERADFLLNAMDAIVNHLDKAATLSRGEFAPAVILRITVGNKEKPLFTGPPHVQDFSSALRQMVDFSVHQLRTAEDVGYGYSAATAAQALGQSTALFEYKDLL
jgi:pyruvate/2-oxoglutarate/acetoin dehydrogenase E1 component